MKVMIGQFNTESNANIPVRSDITAYDIAFGEKCIEKMQVGDIFREKNIDIIPAIYAVAGAAGVIKRETFDYIESCFLRTAREHIGEIDGMYLMLHGASEVEGLGSGDHHILKELRAIVGPYLPIMVVCDPHGNLCKEYVEATTLIRTYRESPHTDQLQSWRWVANELCEFMSARENIYPVYRKLPLILGGEQSVSTDEPVRSINKYMDELEKDERIRSCSWHVGYIRHDTPVAGCGIVVVPQTEKDQDYAEQIADQLADYVWQRRHEFHYTGLTAQPDEALNMALEAKSPAVITDSGDNTTSGATGWNTFILRQVLSLPEEKICNKKILFAPICDPDAYAKAAVRNAGESFAFTIGTGADKMSVPVTVEVELLGRGDICKFVGDKIDRVAGHGALVHIKGTGVDVLCTDTGHPIIVSRQLEYLGINWHDYDITVLKQGYIFPDFKHDAAFYVMSLTDGATPQDTAHLDFKRIMRPMFPVDDI